MNSKKQNEVRRAYSTPVLVKVHLVVDEVMVIACKAGGVGGTGQNSCPAGGNCATNMGS
ncbi:MAG: hypothetical protein ABI333_24935 [bacterium]